MFGSRGSPVGSLDGPPNYFNRLILVPNYQHVRLWASGCASVLVSRREAGATVTVKEKLSCMAQ